ncbi:MAG: hypothetical protein FRX49_08190 [Trebouxia sp. A1-2]|nr:MAG: hypothetical protein FRX49_08190 [Trebouxia sp. A1-2]
MTGGARAIWQPLALQRHLEQPSGGSLTFSWPAGLTGMTGVAAAAGSESGSAASSYRGMDTIPGSGMAKASSAADPAAKTSTPSSLLASASTGFQWLEPGVCVCGRGLWDSKSEQLGGAGRFWQAPKEEWCRVWGGGTGSEGQGGRPGSEPLGDPFEELLLSSAWIFLCQAWVSSTSHEEGAASREGFGRRGQYRAPSGNASSSANFGTRPSPPAATSPTLPGLALGDPPFFWAPFMGEAMSAVAGTYEHNGSGGLFGLLQGRAYERGLSVLCVWWLLPANVNTSWQTPPCLRGAEKMPLRMTKQLIHNKSQNSTAAPEAAGWIRGVEEGPLGGRRPEGSGLVSLAEVGELELAYASQLELPILVHNVASDPGFQDLRQDLLA